MTQVPDIWSIYSHFCLQKNNVSSHNTNVDASTRRAPKSEGCGYVLYVYNSK